MPRPARLPHSLARIGDVVAVAVLCGWSAALAEGLILQVSGWGRSGSEWIHAFLLYGWFSIGAAIALGVLTWPLERRRPRLLETGLAPVLGGALALVVGGMWLNQWSRMPRFGSPAGLLANGAYAVVCVLTAILVHRRRWRRTPPAAVSTTRALLGGIMTLALLGGLGGSGLLPLGGSRSTAAGEAPPVIVLLIDTLRRDHLGCYGYPLETSPNIDRLAREAIVFDAAATSGNFTVPSVASLFTGLPPTRHGVIGAYDQIASEHETLAETFRSAGYRTAAVIANPILRPAMGFTRGFDFCHPAPPPAWVQGRTTALERAAARLRRDRTPGEARAFVPIAVDWLRQPSSRPPFLYLHLIEPHSPYAPPTEHARRFLDAGDSVRTMLPPDIGAYRKAGAWRNFTDLEPGPVVDEHTHRQMVALYDGEIRGVDEWIGSFLDELRMTGLYDEAVIVLLSDHGEEFDDHGGWFHGLTVFEEMVGMPLVIKLPHGRGAGTRSGLLVEMADLAATLASIAGLDPAWRGGGDDLSRQLDTGPASTPGSGRPTSFVERPPHLFALRVGPWKIIRRVRDGVSDDRLFDLGRDPAELEDLASTQPDTLLAMQLRLENVLRKLGELRRAESAGAIDPETVRVLRALGYTE